MIAIDPGTNSMGFAIFNSLSLLVRAGSVIGKGSERQSRTHDIICKLSLEIDGHDEDQVVSEEPLLRGKANKAMERLLGRIEFLFSPKSIEYISPTSVKKGMGHGTFDKSQVKTGVLKLLSLEEREVVTGRLHDSDMMDAVAVGLVYLNRVNKHAETKVRKKKR